MIPATFAGNSAVFWGGALLNMGSDMTISNSRFYRNRVGAGFGSPEVPDAITAWGLILAWIGTAEIVLSWTDCNAGRCLR